MKFELDAEFIRNTEVPQENSHPMNSSSTMVIMLKGSTFNKSHTFLESLVLQWYGGKEKKMEQRGNQNAGIKKKKNTRGCRD